MKRSPILSGSAVSQRRWIAEEGALVALLCALGVLVAINQWNYRLATICALAVLVFYAVATKRSVKRNLGWGLPLSVAAVGLIPIELVPLQLMLLPLAIVFYRRYGHMRRPLPMFWMVAAAIAGLTCGLIAIEYETRGFMPGLYSYGLDGARLSVALAVVLGVAAAGLNSFIEEGVWREPTVGMDIGAWKNAVAIISVNASFGIVHWPEGFPSGPGGAALAGVFGLVAYCGRRFSRDSRVNYLLHFVTDLLIIFYIL